MEFKFFYLFPLLGLCLLFPCLGRKWFYRFERLLNGVAVKPRQGLLVIALTSLLLSTTLSLIRIPVPYIHDEFAYLLGADTFSHGRITNPPHPLWKHFETIQVIQQPTYTCKYPPAQSFALAVGKRIGHPIIGVWLSTAFACLAVYWMLLGWMPPRWAFLGGLIVTVHPLMLTWSHSYWGGAIATSGGAILLGGFRRVVRDLRPHDTVYMGLGIFILANSRPYEGLILVVLTLACLLAWAVSRQGPPAQEFFKKIVLPLALCSLFIGLEIGGYNYAVAGNFLRLPYLVHEDTYGVAPLFVFQKPKPFPAFHHRMLYVQATWYLHYYQTQLGFSGFTRAVLDKLHTLGQGFLWSGFLMVPFLGLWHALRHDRWCWFILSGCVAAVFAMVMATWAFPHYAAPGFAPLVLLIIQSVRQLRLWRWRGKPCGLTLARITLLLCILILPATIFKLFAKEDHPWADQREQIRLNLTHLPGKHLVIVHYSSNHNPNREWVYNESNIDESKVAWARSMTPELDTELVEYFKDRSIWEIQADDLLPQLTHFPPTVLKE